MNATTAAALHRAIVTVVKSTAELETCGRVHCANSEAFREAQIELNAAVSAKQLELEKVLAKRKASLSTTAMADSVAAAERIRKDIVALHATASKLDAFIEYDRCQLKRCERQLKQVRDGLIALLNSAPPITKGPRAAQREAARLSLLHTLRASAERKDVTVLLGPNALESLVRPLMALTLTTRRRSQRGRPAVGALSAAAART